MDHNDITEILLKVVLSTMTLTLWCIGCQNMFDFFLVKNKWKTILVKGSLLMNGKP